MRILIAVLLLMSLSFCKGKKNEAPPPPPDTDTTTSPMPPDDSTTKANVFPLNEKNYWVYNTKHFTPQGKEEVSDYDTMRISRFKEFDGKTYAYINPFWLRNVDHNTIGGYDSILDAHILVKNNATADSSLIEYVPMKPGTDCRYSLKVFAFKTRTTIKDMDCYRVTYINRNCKGREYAVVNLWISEGTGIVQTEFWTLDDNDKRYLHTRQVLESKHLEP